MRQQEATLSDSTTAKKRGRKASPNSKQFKTVGLTKEQWEWLQSWHPSDNPTMQLQELMERSMKFWPAGPAKFR